MAELNIITGPERCRFLTTKGMFVDTGQDPFQSLSAQFWCARTQTCMGPDNQLVDDLHCLAGRSCFDSL